MTILHKREFQLISYNKFVNNFSLRDKYHPRCIVTMMLVSIASEMFEFAVRDQLDEEK